MLLKFVYTLFIGILLATLVGVGIAAFYPQPKSPEYPIELSRPFPEKDVSSNAAELNEKQMAFEKKSREFQNVNELYSKNVSMISLGFAVVFVVLGLLFAKQLLLISDGLLLGAVGTLMYSIARGFSANDDIFRFLVVLISLLIVLTIGYSKFVYPTMKEKKKNSS